MFLKRIKFVLAKFVESRLVIFSVISFSFLICGFSGEDFFKVFITVISHTHWQPCF